MPWGGTGGAAEHQTGGRNIAGVEEGAAALEAMGGLITPLVLTRVDYQEAARYGCGVTEVNPHGSAAAEIKALWASIKRRLARGKMQSRKAA